MTTLGVHAGVPFTNAGGAPAGWDGAHHGRLVDVLGAIRDTDLRREARFDQLLPGNDPYFVRRIARSADEGGHGTIADIAARLDEPHVSRSK